MRISGSLLLLAAIAILPPPAQADVPPPFAFKWGWHGTSAGQFSMPGGIAVAADGTVYVADYANSRIQCFRRDGTFVTAWGSSDGGPGDLHNPLGVAVDGQANVYVADMSGSFSKFTGDGGFLFRRVMGGAACIAVDPTGAFVYVAGGTTNRVTKWTPSGTLVTAWGSPGVKEGQFNIPGGIAVDAAGVVYVADSRNHRVQKFTADGTFLAQWDGSSYADPGCFTYPQSLAVDAQGNVYLAATGRHQVLKFDAEGTLLASWGSSGSADGQFESAAGIAVNSSGDVYVTDWYANRVQMFGARLASDDPPPGPPTPPPPPPPPPTPPPLPTAGHSAAIILHVAPPDTSSACTGPMKFDEIVTTGQARADGSARYYVYLLGTPDTQDGNVDTGLTGIQMGIDYGQQREPGTGINVLGWHRCAVMEFPLDPWPASGSGNTITWGLGDCQKRELAVAGYFYVAAYSTAVMSIIGHPATGLAKVANCHGAEGEVEVPVGPEHLGWVSFGGASKSATVTGCNPGLRPCSENLVPVVSTTWGSIKALFR